MKVIDVSLIALEKALEISEADFAAAQKRIAALEAENAALRDFVAAADKLSSYEQSYPEGLNPLVVLEELDRLQGQFVAIRNRLAAEHGLPLPEVELADDASDDEQHHGPVCWLCGASILFAGFDLCTNCERDMLDD